MLYLGQERPDFLNTKVQSTRKRRAGSKTSGQTEAWKKLQDLAREQGVKPFDPRESLKGGFPPDEDIDAFLEDIYSTRR